MTQGISLMCELSSHHVSLTIGKISRKPGETPQQSVATESFCSWETPLNSHMKAERQAVALRQSDTYCLFWSRWWHQSREQPPNSTHHHPQHLPSPRLLCLCPSVIVHHFVASEVRWGPDYFHSCQLNPLKQQRKWLLRHEDAISRLSYRGMQTQGWFAVLMQEKQKAEGKWV